MARATCVHCGRDFPIGHYNDLETCRSCRVKGRKPVHRGNLPKREWNEGKKQPFFSFRFGRKGNKKVMPMKTFDVTVRFPNTPQPVKVMSIRIPQRRKEGGR